MLEMSAGVDMDTKARGGLAQSFKRMFTGQGLFLTEFTYNQSSVCGKRRRDRERRRERWKETKGCGERDSK